MNLGCTLALGVLVATLHTVGSKHLKPAREDGTCCLDSPFCGGVSAPNTAGWGHVERDIRYRTPRGIPLAPTSVNGFSGIWDTPRAPEFVQPAVTKLQPRSYEMDITGGYAYGMTWIDGFVHEALGQSGQVFEDGYNCTTCSPYWQAEPRYPCADNNELFSEQCLKDTDCNRDSGGGTLVPDCAAAAGAAWCGDHWVRGLCPMSCGECRDGCTDNTNRYPVEVQASIANISGLCNYAANRAAACPSATATMLSQTTFSDCAAAASSGLCSASFWTDPSWAVWIRGICPLSCGACTGTCVDNNRRFQTLCPTKQAQFSAANGDVTCGFNTGTPDCQAAAQDLQICGDTWMKKACPASCGVCHITNFSLPFEKSVESVVAPVWASPAPVPLPPSSSTPAPSSYLPVANQFVTPRAGNEIATYAGIHIPICDREQIAVPTRSTPVRLMPLEEPPPPPVSPVMRCWDGTVCPGRKQSTEFQCCSAPVMAGITCSQIFTCDKDRICTGPRACYQAYESPWDVNNNGWELAYIMAFIMVMAMFLTIFCLYCFCDRCIFNRRHYAAERERKKYLKALPQLSSMGGQ